MIIITAGTGSSCSVRLIQMNSFGESVKNKFSGNWISWLSRYIVSEIRTKQRNISSKYLNPPLKTRHKDDLRLSHWWTSFYFADRRLRASVVLRWHSGSSDVVRTTRIITNVQTVAPTEPQNSETKGHVWNGPAWLPVGGSQLIGSSWRRKSLNTNKNSAQFLIGPAGGREPAGDWIHIQLVFRVTEESECF